MATSILIVGRDKKARLEAALNIAQKQSSTFDIQVIDTEEERGIETSKKVITQASKLPFQSKISSIIIAESQNLTVEAQNALLKTLEEPPQKCHLILTAPTTDTVLPTVASRCLELNIGKKEGATQVTFALGIDDKFSKTLDTLEKIGFDEQLEFWEAKLREGVLNKDSSQVQKLHRYNKTLLKLKKAEKFSVNKKLLTLIAALELPSVT